MADQTVITGGLGKVAIAAAAPMEANYHKNLKKFMDYYAPALPMCEKRIPLPRSGELSVPYANLQ